MTDNTLKDRLLGLAAYEPGAALREGAEFSSAEAYRAFLDETHRRPAAFFERLAAEAGLGAGWNLASICLREPATEDRAQGPALLVADENGAVRARGRAELGREVNALANEMAAWNLEPGAQVLVALPRCEAHVVAILACLRLGLVVVPIDPRSGAAQMSRRVEAARIRAVIHDAAAVVEGPPLWRALPVAGALPEAPKGPPAVPVEARHPVFVLTDFSGEMFTIPAAGFLLQSLSAYRYLLGGRGPDDAIWLMGRPHGPSFLSAAVGSLASGGGVGLVPDAAAGNLDAFLSFLGSASPRVLLTNAKALAALVEPEVAGGRRPSAAGPMLLAVEGEVLEPRIYEYLGAGAFDGRTHITQLLARPEVGGFVAGAHPAVTPVRPSSVSHAAPGMPLEVIDAHGRRCDPSIGGLLALAAPVPGLALELQELEPPIALEVKAREDRAGYLWTMGEVKVDRKAAGEMTLPELEAVVAALPGVEQVAAVRYQSATGDPRTRAFVKPMPGADIDVEDIRRRIAERFGQAAVPDEVQLAKRLPYSRSGKLLRSVLVRISAGEPLRGEDAGLVTDPDVVRELADDLPMK